MGCAGSHGGTPEDEEKMKKSKEIEQTLRKDRKDIAKEMRVLLLGAGETGKTTLTKQMKILFGNGFTDRDRQIYKENLITNILHSIQTLLFSMYATDYTPNHSMFPSLAVPLKPVPPEHASAVDTILGQGEGRVIGPSEVRGMFGADGELVEKVGKAVSLLWSDAQIKKFYHDHSSEIQLGDFTPYLFDNAERILSKSFVPTDDDILHCRIRTSGITEYLFSWGNANFRVIDVGGQRSERRKWIHCFQDVTAVLFFAALSDYDQVLFDDRKENRMKESLLLFGDACNSVWFLHSALILFLNKCDLFREKIATTDLKVCFPEYDGGKDYEKGVEFITKRFLSQNQNREVFVHVTCATDTKMVEKVLNSVSQFLLSRFMDEERML